jgi:alpha-glucosidase (family GH31 glycosyl hydrolase)
MKKIMEKYRYVPIIDAGIKVGGIAYEEGLRRNVYINDALGKPFVGAVWPGDTTFVDFFHPNASSYWQDMLNILYKKVPFDGVWLDMNELSNFCNGPCHTPTTPTVFDYTNDLPYHPGNSQIEDGTIPLNSTHYNGYEEADVHNFNAFLQTKATNAFLKSKQVRPFIVSRSSTIGSSAYGNHWTGDNAATWEFLQGSIANIINS